MGPDPAEDPLVGRYLSHFRIDARLGAGGMGVVYRATDERLRREVALKVLPESAAGDPESRRRFLREARAAAAVTHPNIASVFDIGETDGHAFIAMELIDGETLRARLEASEGGVTHAEALRVAKEIAEGLAEAHARGVVHRDLKPENVMITRRGNVKILDFGLAKLVHSEPVVTGTGATESQTAAGRVMGTPAYMSPEQAEGKMELDVRSDVFSFGTLLYEMLAGVRPFRGDSRIEVMYAVACREPPALEAVTDAVPPRVVSIVARCLRKERAERFASGGELLAALALTMDTASLRPLAAPRPSLASGLGTALEVTLAADGLRVVTVRPSNEASRHRRARWIATLAAAMIVAVPAGLWARNQRRVVTITDQPIPATTVGEARSEYLAGLQMLRDNAWGPAQQHFARAAALDPSMALAHLRLAMVSADTPVQARAEFAIATGLRSELSARDQALMDALEPVIGRAHKDILLASERLVELSARYPRDVEILDWVGILASRRSDVALAAARRATELDPKDGQGWQSLGEWERRVGDAKAARAAFEYGAAGSPDALWSLALLDSSLGRCDVTERESQRYADLDPAEGLRLLASAKIALGRPEAAVRELLDQYITAAPASTRARKSAEADADLAVHAGRFDEALSAFDRQAVLVGASTDYLLHETLAVNQIQTLLETGDAPTARRVARDFTARSESWTRWGGIGADASVDRLPWLTRIAETELAPVDAMRATWIDAKLHVGTTPSVVWTLAWAAPALSPEEARAALDALAKDPRLAPPSLSILPTTYFWEGALSAEAGHAYLLAGRPAGALPNLRRATLACMGLADPFDQAHAELDLGLALEQTGDKAGACESFSRVLHRWGHATPRSITADAARAATRRLACAE